MDNNFKKGDKVIYKDYNGLKIGYVKLVYPNKSNDDIVIRIVSENDYDKYNGDITKIDDTDTLYKRDKTVSSFDQTKWDAYVRLQEEMRIVKLRTDVAVKDWFGITL